jgi:hypothetical protein
VGSVTELERLEIIGESPQAGAPARRSLLPYLLAAALALALVAVAALGFRVYLDHRDTRSATDQAAVAATMAWIDAMNAHDLQATHKAMTSEGRIVFLSEDVVQDGPYSGSDFDSFAKEMYADGFHLTVLHDPVVANGLQVEVLLHMTRGQDDQVNHNIFQLVHDEDGLKVDAVIVLYRP